MLPHMIVMSSDRASMLVLGIVQVEPALRHLSAPQFKMAVVDLKAQRVTAEAMLMGEFHQVADRWAIDDHFVYACPASGNEIVVMNRADLSEVRRLPVMGTPIRLVAIGGTRLMVSANKAPMQTFSVPELQSLDPAGPPNPNAPNVSMYDREGQPAPVRVDDGWFHDGVLWDEKLDGPILLYQPEARFSNVGGLGGKRHDLRGGEYGIAPWGVIASGPFITRTTGEQIAKIQDQEGPNPTSMTLSSVPAVATLARQSFNDTPPHIRSELALYELKTGTRAAAIVLEDLPVRNLPMMGQSQPMISLREMAGGAVVAQLEERLYIISPEQLKKATASFPAPLHFLPRQDVFLIDPGVDTVIKPAIAGGRGAAKLGPPPPPPAEAKVWRSYSGSRTRSASAPRAAASSSSPARFSATSTNCCAATISTIARAASIPSAPSNTATASRRRSSGSPAACRRAFPSSPSSTSPRATTTNRWRRRNIAC
jgi:hypothetical protein